MVNIEKFSQEMVTYKCDCDDCGVSLFINIESAEQRLLDVLSDFGWGERHECGKINLYCDECGKANLYCVRCAGHFRDENYNFSRGLCSACSDLIDNSAGQPDQVGDYGPCCCDNCNERPEGEWFEGEHIKNSKDTISELNDGESLAKISDEIWRSMFVAPFKMKSDTQSVDEDHEIFGSEMTRLMEECHDTLDRIDELTEFLYGYHN